MGLLDYAWNTFASISQAGCEQVSLTLEEPLSQPLIGKAGSRYLIRLPVPGREREGIYSMQGLYADAEGASWTPLWRLFRASVYHAAFHVLHSKLEAYRKWTMDKDRYAAVYAISLVEDFKVTEEAQHDWRALLSDIAYANYVAASRVREPEGINAEALRVAIALLREVWGVSPVDGGGRSRAGVVRAGNKVRSLVQRYAFGDRRDELLVEAAEVAYRLVDDAGLLQQIPSFPHTEAHYPAASFESEMTGGGSETARMLERAYEAMGVDMEKDPVAPHMAEATDALQSLTDCSEAMARISSRYAEAVSRTRLKAVRFPPADISSYLRTRAELSGPIRSVRDQLSMVRNVLGEDPGKESGQVDMVAAMQIIASKQARTDAFVKDELLDKDEAWAILVDASKSISQVASQLRGVTTCLAEVAKDLIREKSKWGLFAFNDTFQIVKDFDEPYSIDTKARIGGLTQEGPTYLPDALVATAKALNSRPIDNKYLVVVSDCLPTGYKGIEGELEERIKTISKSGVMLLGVGVQSSAVRHYFSVNCVTTTPYELLKFFVKAYLELSSASG
ncbi:MAG: VWA domain-containing protein [Nitrososphaerota archaeon]|nr:VWA domain-containing protein [Nitrososphaerota archaeon]